MSVLERGSHAGEAVLPAGPLLDWLDRHPDAMAGWGNFNGRDDMDDLERRRAAAVRRVFGIRQGGPVLFDTAERICVLLEIHPAELWGDAYWRAEL